MLLLVLTFDIHNSYPSIKCSPYLTPSNGHHVLTRLFLLPPFTCYNLPTSDVNSTSSTMASNHGFGTVLALTLALLLFLAIAPPAVLSARPEAKKNPPTKSSGAGFFSPGSGFDIPGFGFPPGFGGIVGGGYGGGYSGPSGGYSRSGVFRPTVVCKEKGPCYNKKLTCPAKCFKSYSSSGKNYGGGGGGGGCTMDFNLPMKKQPLEDDL